ncbi:MAG: hypothetical protein ACFFDQ_06350 [Candidatus Thorarchaeota archaeon]
MADSKKTVRIESEDGTHACAFGICMLTLALACAIGIGTSVLIPNSTVQGSIVFGAGSFLILFALVGGYFVSRGLILVLRESRRKDIAGQGEI